MSARDDLTDLDGDRIATTEEHIPMCDHTMTPDGSMTSLWVRMGELREIEAGKQAEARLTDDALAAGREPIGDPPPDDVPDDDEDDDDDE